MATSFSGGRSQSARKEPPAMGKQLVNFITCGCESSAPFCNLESRAGTHAVLVIGLYELLGNPTTPTSYLIEPPGSLSVEYIYGLFGLVLLCLTSLLAIFQLYRGGHIYCRRKPPTSH